jgi:hypothetical protein
MAISVSPRSDGGETTPQASVDFGLEGLALSRDQKVSVSFADEHVRVLDYAPKPSVAGHSTIPAELIPTVLKFVSSYCFGAMRIRTREVDGIPVRS